LARVRVSDAAALLRNYVLSLYAGFYILAGVNRDNSILPCSQTLSTWRYPNSGWG